MRPKAESRSPPSRSGPRSPNTNSATCWQGSLFFIYEALLDDGSFLVTPSMGLVTADDLIDDIPLLRVAQEAGTWAVDTVVLQSQRNTEFVFPVAGGDQRFFHIQPWIRPDICRGDGATGSAVCARTQTMPPGVAEFVEISATGDTLWSRRIQLPPMPVEDHEFAAHLEQVASMISRSSEGDSIASPRVKRRLREALIVPEFWPAIRGFRLMPNGEVWFLRLKDGASHVWYAARRGEEAGPIRRIVLPEPFTPRGVTSTHVWGDRRDEMDVQYVAGLRLVRAER